MNGTDKNPVERMLTLRGFRPVSCCPTERLVFPPGMDSSFESELYAMLKKYSFRIFIRDVIKNRKSFGVEDLLRYSTREWVERYVAFILERGLIDETRKGRFRLKSEKALSFGDTLEWFVARVFEKEFGSPALWGVRCGGVRAGGDYDVVAHVEDRLAYVEVKSSPPKNVEEAEVAAFLERTEALRPSFAIFLEDTRLRMKDKIVPLFEVLLAERGLKVDRLRDETFSVGKKLYITNSRPDMITNLSFCLRHHLLPESFF